ncbi:hypothetical protein [Egicoccus halophilus]|uniref:hypothetical protein n=1 Tax=Egicoccus halophilus TaxID=1670830 RepID=UPI0010307238|nr:hypothetical protein [Egicoccus halophilus]
MTRSSAGTDPVFHRRHRWLTVALLAHVPPLLALSMAVGGNRLGHALVETSVPLLGLWVIGLRASHQRLAASATTFGLLTASALVVHTTGGQPEAHFHFFLVVAAVALYRDLVVFGVAAAFVVVHHAALTLISPTSVFADPAVADQPVMWAVVHGSYIAAVAAVHAVGLRDVERASRETARLQADLEHAGEARANALALHDTVVQGLTATVYAQQVGRHDLAGDAAAAALTAAKRVVSDLLEGRPADRSTLVREDAALDRLSPP